MQRLRRPANLYYHYASPIPNLEISTLSLFSYKNGKISTQLLQLSRCAGLFREAHDSHGFSGGSLPNQIDWEGFWSFHRWVSRWHMNIRPVLWQTDEYSLEVNHCPQSRARPGFRSDSDITQPCSKTVKTSSLFLEQDIVNTLTLLDQTVAYPVQMEWKWINKSCVFIWWFYSRKFPITWTRTGRLCYHLPVLRLYSWRPHKWPTPFHMTEQHELQDY